ncbi:MAG TPA: error-prone DNA polymerase, partial [Planctomycetota bacterium]|nr:error-prone DNA polymerase [Planctomycetota bacterium]
LGALTQLHRGFDLLREHYGVDIDMARIPPDDPQTFERIRQADTVGVFQIESRAQMSMLPRLKPRTWYDIVIQVSIIRPGPITGGMVHPFLRRRAGEEPVEYPHPSLEPVLARTLGVPLFQEQVIRIAMVAADYTPGEADQLRRDMAAWRKAGRIERHRERLIGRMEAKGIPREFAERVFEQIRGFGEYGFPESHAASFALIAYAGAWMKCHYPDVFALSLLNAQPMGFYSASTIIGDAKRHGVEIRPVDALASEWDSTLEPLDDKSKDAPAPRFAIRLGFRFVKGLRQSDAKRIIEARQARTFRSIEDLARAARVEAATLSRLAEAGAFSELEPNRRRALWAAKGQRLADETPLELPIEERRPDFASLDDLEMIAWDWCTTGVSPRRHPLAPLRETLAERGLPDARTLNSLPDGSAVRYAGIVICRQRPGTAAGVVFMTLEDESGFVNVVVWSDVYERNEDLVKTTQFPGAIATLQVQ